MVERAIQTVKGLLIKSIKNGEDPFLSILQYNSTPKADVPAPCDLLMGRKLRTLCPVPKNLLLPKFPVQNVRDTLIRRQEQQSKYYNRFAKKLPVLEPGETVLLQEKPREWKPATIIRQSGPNDYLVKTNDNAEYRRNRCFLRRSREKEEERPIQEPERENDQEQEEDEPDISRDIRMPDTIVTRSGRVVKPPSRYAP
nr:unnamed protein product [Callosobruchus analis]